MTTVMDSSAILAVLLDEPGSAAVAPRIPASYLSAVNAAEIVSKLVDTGYSAEAAADRFGRLNARTIAFDEETAIIAGQLRGLTRHLGLSLGDRACLALGIRERATVITADRSWAELDLPCTVELIRE